VPATTFAQVVQVQAGSSSLYDAHGGSVELRNGSVTLGVGAGQLGGSFTAGLSLRASVGSFIVGGGDQIVDFDLPTDVFGGSRYVPIRGAGLERRSARTRVVVIGGLTSQTMGAPFFKGARGGDGAGLVFVERQLTTRTKLFSKNAAAQKAASISGLAWRPREWLGFALAGGVGNAKPYAATSVEVSRSRLQLGASFVHQRPGFRRITLDSPLSAEPTAENVSVVVRPTSRWSVSLQRRRMLDSDATTSNDAVALNQVGASLNVAGFRLIGAAYESTGPRPRQLGVSASIGRRLTRSTDLMVDYFRSESSGGSLSESYVARLHTTVSSRVGLLQVATHSGGQTSFNVGGEFLSNPLRVSVTYNTVYAPLRHGNPFVQVVGVDGQLNIFDRMTLNLATYTTPTGQPRYSVSGNIIGGSAGGGARIRSSSLKMARYIVRGRVENEAGEPVAGAVLHVGPEVLSTDRDGRFFWRTDRRDALRVQVAPAEFLAPGRFEVVSAPTALVPETASGPGSESVIVVRRF
jgi:hypothetical protein